jgi:hypothetical protein
MVCLRRKCNSSSTSLLEHLGHVLLCRGIPWCLPFSILRECADKRNLVKCFLISMLFITDKYFSRSKLFKYYYRLKNIQSDFLVLHDASEESKILSHSNKPSWYASINYIFKIIKTYKSGNYDKCMLVVNWCKIIFYTSRNGIYRHKLMVNYALRFWLFWIYNL